VQGCASTISSLTFGVLSLILVEGEPQSPSRESRHRITKNINIEGIPNSTDSAHLSRHTSGLIPLPFLCFPCTTLKRYFDKGGAGIRLEPFGTQWLHKSLLGQSSSRL
jgi:hypothetical protein